MAYVQPVVDELDVGFYAYAAGCESGEEGDGAPVVVVRVDHDGDDVAAEVGGPAG